MSAVLCEGCDALFDSDDDPDCFVEVGNMRRLHQTKILCASCRDQREAELERDGPPDREFTPEQEAIIERMEKDNGNE